MGKSTREQLELKRQELNILYAEQGLNDFTLKKSQELDVLITKVQRMELENLIKNDIIA